MILGTALPDLTVQTTKGEIRLIDYAKKSAGSYLMIFSHPADYTPVCTTELGEAARLTPEFEQRNVKMLGLSCEDVDSHSEWIKDIRAATGQAVKFPLMGDSKRQIAYALGMVSEAQRDQPLEDGPVMAVRSVLIYGPTQQLALTLTYPASTGRNFHEILRVIDSLQLTASHKVATPVNWVKGQDCMVLPKIPQAEAVKLFTEVRVIEVPSQKEYLRMVKDPKNGESMGNMYIGGCVD
jgi:alkyl hydroperoxide reductase subunit AhpC